MLLWLAPGLLLIGCNEQDFREIQIEELAVVLGDFDHVGDVLIGMGIGTTEYDGFIVQATYEPEDERIRRGEMALTVEGLLQNLDKQNRIEINLYQVTFLNSGVRGLNAVQYNDPLLPDDSLLLQPELLDPFCDYVESGNTLVVSDWSYEVIPYCWPDAIRFKGDGAAEGAQLGQPGDVIATVGGDEAFRKRVGGPTVNVSFDYTGWAVMDGVGKDTTVLLSGDGFYQPSASELPELAVEIPLMVRFTAGKGQVVFSSFHWATQGGLAASLLGGAIEGLDAAAGNSDTTGGDNTGGETE
jgi:hypothetical protein